MAQTQNQWLDQVGSVLETLNQGVIISDEDRRIIFANSMFLEMGKMSAADILGRSVMDLYPEDEAGQLQECNSLEQAIRQQSSFDEENRLCFWNRRA